MNKLVKLLWPYLRKVQPWTLPRWAADCAWYLLHMLHQRLDEIEASQGERFWIVDFWGDYNAMGEETGVPVLDFHGRAWNTIKGLRAASNTLQPLIAAFELVVKGQDRTGNVEPIHSIQVMEGVLAVAREFGDEALYQQTLGWAVMHLNAFSDGGSYLDDFDIVRVYGEQEEAEEPEVQALQLIEDEEFDELWQQGFEKGEDGGDHACRL